MNRAASADRERQRREGGEVVLAGERGLAPAGKRDSTKRVEEGEHAPGDRGDREGDEQADDEPQLHAPPHEQHEAEREHAVLEQLRGGDERVSPFAADERRARRRTRPPRQRWRAPAEAGCRGRQPQHAERASTASAASVGTNATSLRRADRDRAGRSPGSRLRTIAAQARTAAGRPPAAGAA